MFVRLPALIAATLLLSTPARLPAQSNVEQDFSRMIELWELLVSTLATPPEGCAPGADSARVWADRHLREVVVIEGRLADAADEPANTADSATIDVLSERFFTAFEQWFDWGLDCYEDPHAVAAGQYVDSLRTEYELEILGISASPSRLEQDLAALDDAATAALALVIDGESMAQSGNIEMAIEAFRQVPLVDSTFVISPNSWNELCWFGSLWGHAKDVLFACDRAVQESGGETWIIDSRGVARALTGNFEGAIADFETYIPEASGEERVRREAWVAALKAGENPFTEEVLRGLRRG